jgi:hypothetical protein
VVPGQARSDANKTPQPASTPLRSLVIGNLILGLQSAVVRNLTCIPDDLTPRAGKLKSVTRRIRDEALMKGYPTTANGAPYEMENVNPLNDK